jgi:aminoglycoside phosphotransferase (APT) family kinase protein
LQECVEGHDLRYAVASGDKRALSASAKWLVRLHNTAPICGLKTTSLQDELEKVNRRCLQIRPHLSQADLRRLCRAEDRLQRLAARLPGYAPAMVHNDFYYANVLWDGKCIWVLDFDQLRLSDPALDVGHFAAHVESFAYRTTGRADSFAESVLVFVKSYAARAALDLDISLPFHRASAFLKLAATEVIRQRGDWRQLTTALTSLACRDAELLTRQS